MPDEQITQDIQASAERDSVWLQLASLAYDQSTSFMDNNYRKQWEDALRHFANKHHAGSKYHSAEYKYRSKIFRPKTRSAIRNNEAAAVAAFFSNQDVVSIEPQNPDDPNQVASVEITKELINYRMENTIPWFLTCIGGIQDAMKVGVVASYQDWEYDERTNTEQIPQTDQMGQPIVDPETGQPMMAESTSTEIRKDQPRITLLPIENVRIHPAASWMNPAQSSPYLIILWPMYVQDVKAKMKQGDQKTGKKPWKQLGEGELKSGRKFVYDSTRSVREGQREEKYDQTSSAPLSEFDIVWVHQNFMRVDKEEIVFYTLGTEHLLSEPEFLEDVCPIGERPVVIGCSLIETHKLMPPGYSELGSEIQKEINEVANLRLDNVKLVMNKRWLMKRGKQVDTQSLLRNAAGSITLVDDHDDLKEIEFNDVTASSYNEQDRLNVDIDELLGSFSASTIQTNRKMNETVGGMSMLKGTSNTLSEYTLRTYGETWVEPVMKQIVKLEQAYETDETVLAIAASKAQLWQRFGIDTITDRLIRQDLSVKVSAGSGSTDPMFRLEKFLLAVGKYSEIEAQQVQIMAGGRRPTLNLEEVQGEIFGRLGYKSGKRFFMPKQQEDPQTAQLAQQMQEMQGMIQELQMALKDKQQDRETKLMDTQMREQGQNQRKAAELNSQVLLKQMDLQNPVAGENV